MSINIFIDKLNCTDMIRGMLCVVRCVLCVEYDDRVCVAHYVATQGVGSK